MGSAKRLLVTLLACIRQRPLTLPIALALLTQTACSTFGPQYQRRYFPGDESARQDGKVEVFVRAYPQTMIKPQWITYTVQIRGELPECGHMTFAWGDGEVSTWSGCGLERAPTKRHFVKRMGSVTTTVSVYAPDGKTVLGVGRAELQIGASEPME